MTFESKRDLYEILGVDATATSTAIKKAHRARIREVHPDKPNGSTEMSAAVNHARDVLSDPEQRAAYDALRANHRAKPKRPRAASAKGTRRGTSGKRASPGTPTPTPAPPWQPPSADVAVPSFDSPQFLPFVATQASESWARGWTGVALLWGAVGALKAYIDFKVPVAAPPGRA